MPCPRSPAASSSRSRFSSLGVRERLPAQGKNTPNGPDRMRIAGSPRPFPLSLLPSSRTAGKSHDPTRQTVGLGVLPVASLVAGLLGTVPARAAPGGDATVEVQSFTAAANSSAHAFASCPLGKRVVWGGVDTTGPVTTQLDYSVELSGPLGRDGSHGQHRGRRRGPLLVCVHLQLQ